MLSMSIRSAPATMWFGDLLLDWATNDDTVWPTRNTALVLVAVKYASARAFSWSRRFSSIWPAVPGPVHRAAALETCELDDPTLLAQSLRVPEPVWMSHGMYSTPPIVEPLPPPVKMVVMFAV